MSYIVTMLRVAGLKPMADEAANTTALSHPLPSIFLILPKFWRLARWSLGMTLTMFASTGCIVAGPPELNGPQKTPPFLFLNEAFPPMTAINKVAAGDTVEVSVPVRSEDAGDRLFGLLFQDFGSTRERQVGITFLPASTLAEKRVIGMTWDVPSGEQCRQLTLLVTHVSNLGADGRPIDGRDVALATWWFAIGGTFDATDCPEPLGSVR